MNAIIEADTTQVRVAINPLGQTERLRLLEDAAAIISVTTAEEQALAVYRGRAISSWLAQVEANRKAVKSPVLALEKRIDALAKEYCTRLEAEKNRLGILVNEFQRAEDQRIAEETRKRQEAIEKAQADEAAAKELAAQAEAALTTEEAGLTEAEQAILAQEMVQQTSAQVEDVMRVPMPSVSHTVGQIIRDTIEFEITDEKALYAVRPDFFSLVPKRSVIRDSITEETQLPGLRVWREKKVGFRS